MFVRYVFYQFYDYFSVCFRFKYYFFSDLLGLQKRIKLIFKLCFKRMKILYEENKKIYYFIYQIEYIFVFIDYLFLRKKIFYIYVKNGYLLEKILSFCSL